MAGLAMRGPVNVTLTVRAATRMAAAPAQNRQALPAACTD
jgi:hypothetical protein